MHVHTGLTPHNSLESALDQNVTLPPTQPPLSKCCLKCLLYRPHKNKFYFVTDFSRDVLFNILAVGVWKNNLGDVCSVGAEYLQQPQMRKLRKAADGCVGGTYLLLYPPDRCNADSKRYL
jgi:hypothetical protein